MNKLEKNLIAFLFLFIIVLGSTSILVKGNQKIQPIFSVDRDDKAVALTFDINWAENDSLISILDVLDKYNVKGTFFLMGRWINYSEENLEKLKEINKRGHEIGNHSYIHPMFTKITPERMIEEVKKTEDIIYEHTGTKTKLFRCPSGDYNDSVIKTVDKLGYNTIQWDVDSVDWKEIGQEAEYNRVINKIKSGSIVLFHNNAKYTPKNLPIIIENLIKEGYKFLTVGDLIYKENFIIDNNGVQKRLNNNS